MKSTHTVSKEELQHRIKDLAEESQIYVPSDVIEKAVGFIEFLIRSGFDCPLKVEPILGNDNEKGGLRVKLKNGYARAELELRRETNKSVLKIYHDNSTPVFEMTGNISVR